VLNMYNLADIKFPHTKALRVLMQCYKTQEGPVLLSHREGLPQISPWRYNLTLAESKFKTPMLNHQDKHMMKAQVHVSKSSAISDLQPLPLRKHYCQIYQVVKHMLRGRLLASFQDHEHEGGDTRMQDGIKDNDDNESLVDEIIFDLNRAPDLPDQFHCFHCKDVLRDGEACKRCTCAKCRSGLSKGLCYICGHNQNSLNDSSRISKTSSQSPPNINHCCYECVDPLDGIFCKRCTCKSCGKDAHIGYNCPLKVPVISIPEPCNNQTSDELPQALPIFHPTFHSEAESPFTLDSTPTY
nr:hypothetical protein [Tanacetum cinerariifolium]